MKAIVSFLAAFEGVFHFGGDFWLWIADAKRLNLLKSLMKTPNSAALRQPNHSSQRFKLAPKLKGFWLLTKIGYPSPWCWQIDIRVTNTPHTAVI
jgi:hypothetical protein